MPRPDSDFLALIHAARGQQAAHMSAPATQAPFPTIVNQQIDSRGGGSRVGNEHETIEFQRYVELFQAKLEVETQLRITQAELETLKSDRNALKGDLKATTTVGRSAETKAINALKEEKRALENAIEDLKLAHSEERLGWSCERQELRPPWSSTGTPFKPPSFPLPAELPALSGVSQRHAGSRSSDLTSKILGLSH
ncbi:hypothetical protein CF327_g7092 [Tilletia walkeri]|nr:hypothetical protein CF327_g7092 [Tilletia walkeri]